MPKTTKNTNKYATDSEFVRNLERDITAFIKVGPDQADTDTKFNEMALRLFNYQYNANAPYQKYCAKRGIKPGDIESWKEIPAVPTTAFKEVPLCCFPSEQAVKLLTSSGTTDQTKRSRLYYDEMGLRCLDLCCRASLDHYMFLDFDKACALLLAPPPKMTPNLAMAYYTTTALKDHLIGEPRYFITRDGFDLQGLVDGLRESEESGEPALLIGPTFGFVHFFDFCKSKGISFNLPEKSLLNDGGGFKGQSREIAKEDYFEMAHQVLGLPAERILNSYGMSELAGGFIDNGLYNHVNRSKEPRYKIIPHWVRTVVVDPETLEELPKGEQGLLRHHSLGSMSNVQVIQTDDLGYAIGGGLKVVGRAKGAEARGCSIAMDELISAQKTR